MPNENRKNLNNMLAKCIHICYSKGVKTYNLCIPLDHHHIYIEHMIKEDIFGDWSKDFVSY